MSISRTRLRRAELAVAELCRDPRAEALADANNLVATLVAMDLLHVDVGQEQITDPKLLLDHVVELWLKHAKELGVPNDGSAERRILDICRNVAAGDASGREGAGGLADHLEQRRR